MSTEHPAKSNRQLQIGKFRILERIATGGMGAVYKARDTENDRVVALKILSPETAAKPRMIERFRLEALHGSKLHHPNVVTLYESGEVNGIHYLALEFVEGVDLQTYILQKGQLDVDQSRLIIIQATKAIAHLHQQGVIHRDIKPSNFLIRYKDGQPVIKLIDLGLARHRDDDEDCRMTKAGSTVGTVDYIAPEQARNSGAADVRSDIYSLGCSWYHMLTGQPPFTEGSMLERLYKHVEDEPPDVRSLNPDVPELVVRVIKRMMAKDPSDRYQTPAALLRELQGTDPQVQPFSKRVLAGLAQEDEPDDPEGRPRRGTRVRGGRTAQAGRRKPSVLLLVSVAAGLTVAIIVGMLVARQFMPPAPADDKKPEAPEAPSVTTPPLPLSGVTKPGSRPPPTSAKKSEPAPRPIDTKPPAPSALPVLYEPVVPINIANLNREWEQPWEKAASLPAGPTFRVARGSRGGSDQTFESLAEACAAAPAGQETIIEIHTNGPLYEGPISVSGRSLVLRAGKGFRPLLAWDAKQAPAGKGEQFLSLSGGRLTLENLEVVCQTTAQGQTDTAALFRVTEGDLTAEACTFSVAGNHSAGVAVVRLEGAATAACKCRLNHCYLRGTEVIAVEVRVPGAEVLLDGCLAAGGNRPLVDVRGPLPLVPATLRVRRSTLVAGQALIRLQPDAPAGRGPGLRFLGWDTLLARSGAQTEEAMLVVRERTDPSSVQWQAINCLYAGWRTLLKAPELTIANLQAWRDHFHERDGDASILQTWPAGSRGRPEEVPAAEYLPGSSAPVRYAATSGPGVLGFHLAALPPARDHWLRFTYGPFTPDQVDLPKAGARPAILPPADNHYHGEQLDLAKIGDLGAYLQDIQKNHPLAHRVVLHLTGSGEQSTSPIAWKDSSLVLCFVPPADDAEPLVLIPNGATVGHHEALIEVVNGNLEIVGGAIRFTGRNLLPASMLKVQGGDLSLAGCRLEGPLAKPPANYRGLIQFEGAGNGAKQTHACALADSVMTSAQAVLRLVQPGIRLRMENCLLVANGDALEFDPAAADQPPLRLQAALRRNTVAVNGAVLHLKDAAGVPVPAEPILVQATANVFMDPFRGPSSQAGVLRYERAAVNRGLLIWQGQGNLFDKRFLYYAQSEGERLPDKPQAYAAWTRLWGTAGERNPVADVGLPHPLALDESPPLGQLALPPLFKNPPLGADFARLGFSRKRPK
jgi:serine/threonine protein kinase